jgi:hypothetical protein
MFCPRCSQEQISEEIKYCKRCGFLLTDISEALQNNRLVRRNVVQTAQDLKKATVTGVSVMALGGIFFILSLIFGTPEPSLFVQFNLLVGLLVFVFGMALIAYNFWLRPYIEYGRETRKSVLEGVEPELIKEIVKEVVGTKPDEKLLKEQDLSQLANYAAPPKSYTTNDLTKTPSVTEETTKNLKFEK